MDVDRDEASRKRRHEACADERGAKTLRSSENEVEVVHVDQDEERGHDELRVDEASLADDALEVDGASPPASQITLHAHDESKVSAKDVDRVEDEADVVALDVSPGPEPRALTAIELSAKIDVMRGEIQELKAAIPCLSGSDFFLESQKLRELKRERNRLVVKLHRIKAKAQGAQPRTQVHVAQDQGQGHVQAKQVNLG